MLTLSFIAESNANRHVEATQPPNLSDWFEKCFSQWNAANYGQGERATL